MAEIDRRYFESLMADRKLSLRGLAKLMGMSHSQLSLAFSGARRLQLEEVAQMSQLFGEPLHRVVEAAGVSVRPVAGRRVAVIGAMRGDGTVEEYGSGVVERTGAPDGLPSNTAAVQCRTMGTALDYLDGAVFFFREPNGVDPSSLGRLSYVKIKGGPAAISKVGRGYREASFNLSGPFSQESAAIEFATPINFTRN